MFFYQDYLELPVIILFRCFLLWFKQRNIKNEEKIIAGWEKFAQIEKQQQQTPEYLHWEWTHKILKNSWQIRSKSYKNGHSSNHSGS